MRHEHVEVVLVGVRVERVSVRLEVEDDRVVALERAAHVASRGERHVEVIHPGLDGVLRARRVRRRECDCAGTTGEHDSPELVLRLRTPTCNKCGVSAL